MDRRKFLKILAVTSIAAAVSPTTAFAKIFSNKILEAVRQGRYPGKIKSLNNAEIEKQAKWLG